jgi:transducin beta-like protein 2
VKLNKNGTFEKTTRAFELVGHHSGVWDFAFDPDSSHVATICKDGTWKLFNINGRYFIEFSVILKILNPYFS